MFKLCIDVELHWCWFSSYRPYLNNSSPQKACHDTASAIAVNSEETQAWKMFRKCGPFASLKSAVLVLWWGTRRRPRLFQFHVQCLSNWYFPTVRESSFLYIYSSFAQIEGRPDLQRQHKHVRMWHRVLSGSNPYQGSRVEICHLYKFRFIWLSLRVKHLGWQLQDLWFEPNNGPLTLSKIHDLRLLSVVNN